MVDISVFAWANPWRQECQIHKNSPNWGKKPFHFRDGEDVHVIRRQASGRTGCEWVLPVQCRDQPPGRQWRCPLFLPSGGSPSHPSRSPGPAYTWGHRWRPLTWMHVHRLCIIHTQISTHALMASVTDPIWLTFSRRQLQALSSTAFCILRGLVTVKSSPTTWEEKKQDEENSNQFIRYRFN